MDVGGILEVLRLGEDVQEAPLFTSKTKACLKVALRARNDDGVAFPSSGSDDAPATNTSVLVHVYKSKIQAGAKFLGEHNTQGDRRWGGRRQQRQPPRSAIATTAAAMRTTTYP